MVGYPPFIVLNIYHSYGDSLVCWNTDSSEFLQSLKDIIYFTCFPVWALEASAFKSLLEESFSTAVRKHPRLSDPCFAVFIPNVVFKPVFRPVVINIEFSSITSLTSVSVVSF